MKRWVAACISSLLLGVAQAADFDGSKLLICANMEAADCNSGQACTRGRPEELGAPAFIRIDFANKAIVGPRRTTPIVGMATDTDQILLQGTEMGYAWSIALNTGSGRLAATLVDHDSVIVLFGACTVQ
jgi:hypothetical protein